MIRKSAVFVIVFGLSIFIGICAAFAQSCPDVLGEWDITGEQILAHRGDAGEFSFHFNPLSGELDIVKQDGCLFHGEITLGAFTFPVVGTITGRIIKMVSGDAVIDARLRGYDRNTGLFTIMKLTACDTMDWFETPDEYMSCGQGTATRK